MTRVAQPQPSGREPGRRTRSAWHRGSHARATSPAHTTWDERLAAVVRRGIRSPEGADQGAGSIADTV
eukprot:5003122-Pyramimonas_sp.AAC.1